MSNTETNTTAGKTRENFSNVVKKMLEDYQNPSLHVNHAIKYTFSYNGY